MAGCRVVVFCTNCYLDDMSLELHTFLFLATSVLHVQTCKQVASVHTNYDIEEVENQAPLVTHLGVGAGHRQNHLPNLHQIGTKLFPSLLKTLKKNGTQSTQPPCLQLQLLQLKQTAYSSSSSPMYPKYCQTFKG